MTTYPIALRVLKDLFYFQLCLRDNQTIVKIAIIVTNNKHVSEGATHGATPSNT